MTTDIETLAELRNKVFRRAAAIRKLIAVEQIICKVAAKGGKL